MVWQLRDMVRAGTTYDLLQFPFKIGRNASANLICRSHNISKSHAMITIENNQIYIRDTSSNGVFVNNVRVCKGELFEIKDKDIISLCISQNQAGKLNIVDKFIYELQYFDDHYIDTPPSSNCEQPMEQDGTDDENEEAVLEDNVVLDNNRVEVPEVLENNRAVIQEVLDVRNDGGNNDQILLNVDNINKDVDENYIIEILNSQEEKLNQSNLKLKESDSVMIVEESDIQIIEPKEDIIIIDDEGDDELCSQLYIKQEIKEEFDEEHVRIKQELAELDRYALDYNSQPIEILENDSHDLTLSSDDDELSRCLKNYTCDVEYIGPVKSPEIMFEPSPEYDANNPLENVLKSPEEEVKNVLKTSTKTIEEVSLQIEVRNKQHKPEVIDALPLIKTKRKRTMSASKQTGKSKQSDETVEKKKSKTDNEKQTKQSKVKDNNNKNKSKVTNKIKTSNTCVKTSKNRGAFLLNEVDTKNITSKKYTVPEKLTFANLPKIPKIQVQNSNSTKTDITHTSILASPKPKINSETTTASAQKALFHSAPTPPRYQPPLHNSSNENPVASTSKAVTTHITNRIDPRKQNQIPYINPETKYNHGKQHNRDYKTDQEHNLNADKQHNLYNKHHNQAYHRQKHTENKGNESEQIFSTYRSFLMRVFLWNSEIIQDNNITNSWQLFEGAPITKLPLTYNDYRYYQRAMSSVVLSELYTDVSNDYKSMTVAKGKPRRLKAFVKRVIPHSDHTELLCYHYLPDEQVSDKIRDSNLLSFFPRYSDKNKVASFLFGVVDRSTIQRITQHEDINPELKRELKSFPKFKLTFTLLTQKEVIIKEDFIFIRNFGSMRRYFTKLKAIKKVVGSLAQQIIGCDTNKFSVCDFSMSEQAHHFLQMNTNQEAIVQQAMKFCSLSVKSKFFLVQGPPGTGKSEVIVNIALNLLKKIEKGHAVLLLAQSNAAVDNLMRRIYAIRRTLPVDFRSHVRMIRLGNAPSDLAPFQVNNLVARNMKRNLFERSPHLKYLHRQLEHELFSLKSKSELSTKELETLKSTESKIENFVQEFLLFQYKNEEIKTRDNVFEKANLICSTIGSSCIFPNNRIDLTFKCCIIDEATQATEPDTLLPLSLGVNKFILVGDTRQLPAVHTRVPQEYQFSRSLFSRLQKIVRSIPNQNILHLLDTQYRMREEICAFPNNQFYDGRLITCPRRVREDIKEIQPYLVFEAVEQPLERSTYVNTNEIKTARLILTTLSKLDLQSTLSIGIITPYNEQRIEFNKMLEQASLNRHMNVVVKTIDSFQGQEQDIIILSFVLRISNKFLDDAQRLNVALTRAKHCLYVLGSPILFDSSSLLRLLRDDAIKREVYVPLSSSMDSDRLHYHLFI